MPAGNNTKKTRKTDHGLGDYKPSKAHIRQQQIADGLDPDFDNSAFGRAQLHELELPSGFVIRIRRPGVLGLVKAGIIDGLDTLTGIVEGETIPKAEGRPVKTSQAQALELVKDKQKMSEIMDILDKITVHVCVEPRVYPVPVVHEDPEDESSPVVAEPSEEQLDAVRDPELAYVDLVADEDKTFIMNYVVGGSRDLASFRQGTEEALGSVPAGEAASASAE